MVIVNAEDERAQREAGSHIIDQQTDCWLAMLHRQNLIMTMDPFPIHHLQSHYGYCWSY